ncbi:DoxX family protein [Pontibacter sp. 172403-2]|uniref:DoxX family protein n=1 Tax=Pontibacter rufus TaxID=2791028 RepID=UPI0018AFAFA7|nr:DoxX family protein [Pontibacter sp. 172403-2]MBF9255025.1 DoxX family protein [Pontibacter sp. 172403-2]
MGKFINFYLGSGNKHVALLIVRVSVAGLMLAHGLPKLEMLFSGDALQFPAVFGLSAASSLTLAVFAEVACSVLILVGLGTRLAVIPLIITMLVAAFFVHGADPFAQKELAILYLLPYITLLFMGSGKYALDHLLQQKLSEAVYVRRLSME